jgi:hypothetical protein
MQTDHRLEAWAACWSDSTPPFIVYEGAASISICLTEADVFLAGPPDAETATEMTAWLSEGEILFELYFVRDRVLASRPFIRFSSVTDAIVFRMRFDGTLTPNDFVERQIVI